MTRTIPELAARYRLEPSIRDVFLEGRSDVQLVGRVLRSLGLRDVIAYKISTVDIPAAHLIAKGFEDGARGRVLYLALEFDRTLDPATRGVTCVADRDYDYLLGRLYSSPFLLFADYSCSEMYAFDASTVEEVIRCVQPAHRMPIQSLMNTLSGVLTTLFTLRATNIRLGLGLAWMESFTDNCVLSDGAIEFDVEGFLVRYLNTRGMLGRTQDFRAVFEEFGTALADDPRLSINGHDFVVLLAWYLRQLSGKANPLLRPEVLHQLLLAYVDPARISREGLFRSLAERVGRAGSGL